MKANNLARLQPFYNEIARTAGLLWQKGWAERNAGNISRVVPLEDAPLGRMGGERIPLLKPLPGLIGKVILMTGTGTRMREVATDPRKHISIITLVDEGQTALLLSPEIPPTSELPSHLEILNYLVQHRPGYHAIVHTHPTQVIALSHLKIAKDPQLFCNIIWKMIPESYVFLSKGITLLPYLMPGSHALAKASTAAFTKGGDVIVWAKHGALAIAANTEEAFDHIDLVEKSAAIYLAAKATGEEPQGLSDEDLAALKAHYLL
ncbi:MAG: rhamnulose-1-phosphate aldolase [Bacteroidetes bacterium]|nr:MAG: rhamnulose-1-phosphate aldolase [Bacteroidota bacterium]PIE88573.1 MAG: rhamnulose-1-phosphate aldolase [Bacteroidota bacterium]